MDDLGRVDRRCHHVAGVVVLMIRRFIAWLFGPCIAAGHQWVFIPPTPEEAAQDHEAYQEWFDDYPLTPYPTLHGHSECAICGKAKVSASFGRPSGHHPGWG